MREALAKALTFHTLCVIVSSAKIHFFDDSFARITHFFDDSQATALLNSSINEKLSRIRQAFRAVAHDSVANCYIVQGERGEKRSITLSDEYIELGEWGKE